MTMQDTAIKITEKSDHVKKKHTPNYQNKYRYVGQA